MGIMMKYKIKARTHNVKCFIHCVFEKLPILEVANKRFKAEDNQVCLSIKNDDKCQESFNKFECYVKLEKKLLKNKGQSPKWFKMIDYFITVEKDRKLWHFYKTFPC